MLQVTHDLGIGGLPNVVKTLSLALDRERFEVSVLCLHDSGPLGDELERAGIPVLVLGWRPPPASYLAFVRIWRLLRQHEIDVVHTHNIGPLLDAGVAAILGGTRTWIHTDHGKNGADRWFYPVIEHVLSHFVDRVVGVSEHTTRYLNERQWIARRKLETIPNGIDPAPYRSSFDRFRKRAELGIPPDNLVVGFAARLEEQKGVIHLLQALVPLSRRIPNLTVLIAGEGRLAEELKRAAGALGVADRVRFLGVRRDVPELLQVFDVFVLPSIWEGLPMVILEAQAAGCPIVASGVGGVPAAIEHRVSGSLVAPASPEALASELALVLADERLRKRYGAEGRRVFADRYDASVMARRYESLYVRHSPRGRSDAGAGRADAALNHSLSH